MKHFLILAAFLALTFLACTNSDDALYDESSNSSISISAKLLLEKDSISRQGKADTVRPGDTLTFIADIEPSRSIRIQRYYWTLDGDKWASEFSFRSNISEPGHHEVVFVLVDYFGDTLTDTLHVWVGNLPILDEKAFIPHPGTQQIPTESGISFAWHAYDPDSIYSMRYRFILKDASQKDILDTIIDKANLVYQKPLDPLAQYYWSVFAFNEIGMTAPTAISSSFFTKGAKGESAIAGKIQTSAYGNRISFDSICVSLAFLDSSGETISTDTLSGRTDEVLRYSKKPLAPGTYKVITSLPRLTDYIPDTMSAQLLPSEVYKAETIYLNDIAPPTIRAIPSGDTLDFLDTLRFFVKDGGTNLSSNDIQINFNSKRVLEGASFQKDTLAIALKDFSETVAYRLLTITATDLSGNKNKRTFYIKPALSWFECNGDTTIYSDETLEVFIHDTNPYGFEPDSFYFDIFKNDKPAAFEATEDSLSFPVIFSTFPNSVNRVRTGIRYTNGIVKWKEWTVNRMFTARSQGE